MATSEIGTLSTDLVSQIVETVTESPLGPDFALASLFFAAGVMMAGLDVEPEDVVGRVMHNLKEGAKAYADPNLQTVIHGVHDGE